MSDIWTENEHTNALARARDVAMEQRDAAQVALDSATASNKIMLDERDNFLQTIAQLRDHNTELDHARIGAARELNAFKEQVVEVAAREAEERGWCSEINDILAELGLELPAKKVEIEFTVTFTMEAGIRPGSGMHVFTRDVARSMNREVLRDYITDAQFLDEDWTDQVIENFDVEVKDVREA